MRNYKQVDTEVVEEVRIRKRDIFAVAVAILGASIFIWGVM